MPRSKSSRTAPAQPPTPNAPPSPPVRALSVEERRADIQAFGREIRQSKAKALGFLQRAGILDEHGELIESLRP